MSKKASSDLYFRFLIGVSFFSLFIIGITIIFPPISQGKTPWRKPVIGIMYAMICLLGIIAAFFPSKCSSMLNHKSKTRNSLELEDSINKKIAEDSILFWGHRIVHGHHTQCKAFSDHELRIGRRTFCIGCLSFVLGAIVSVIVTYLYFSNIWSLGINSSLVAGLGLVMVGFGLLHLVIFDIHGPFRLLPNLSLVIGTTFTLLAVDVLVGSYILDGFILASSIFWVWTKISVARRDHMRICLACGLNCSARAN